jgi:hypothetical protein
MTKKFTWNEENTARLVELAGTGEVSQDQLISISEDLGTTARSIGAKLRNMEFPVAKAATKQSAWSESQEAELSQLVEGNSGTFTYAEVAATFQNGVFSAKQVQGKILSMELFTHIRKAEKVAAPRTYTPDEEVKFIAMVVDSASMEDLSDAFGRSVASVRGKALSLLRSEDISAMPKQAKSAAKERTDVLEGIDVASQTIEGLVDATGKTERGIKSILSRRGISCENYDGAAKRAKLDKADTDAA